MAWLGDDNLPPNDVPVWETYIRLAKSYNIRKAFWTGIGAAIKTLFHCGMCSADSSRLICTYVVVCSNSYWDSAGRKSGEMIMFISSSSHCPPTTISATVVPIYCGLTTFHSIRAREILWPSCTLHIVHTKHHSSSRYSTLSPFS